MKNELFKSLAIALLTLGVAVGCASTPEDTGPTADELAAQQAAEEAAARNADLLAQAQAMADEISGYSNLTADQQARLEAGKQAIANQDGQGAYDTLSALLAELQAASMTYEVVAGDNLWDISGKPSVYGNPAADLQKQQRQDSGCRSDLSGPDAGYQHEPDAGRCGFGCRTRPHARRLVGGFG